MWFEKLNYTHNVLNLDENNLRDFLMIQVDRIYNIFQKIFPSEQ
jgi:hypothetical protein